MVNAFPKSRIVSLSDFLVAVLRLFSFFRRKHSQNGTDGLSRVYAMSAGKTASCFLLALLGAQSSFAAMLPERHESGIELAATFVLDSPSKPADPSTTGPKDAPVTIIEFSDFECPFSRKAAPIIQELLRANPGKIRLRFRHNPL